MLCFYKTDFLTSTIEFTSEKGEKQFPLPILLNTHLFLNRFIMSPFAMRNVQSKNSTKQFIAYCLSSFLTSRRQYVPPSASLPEGKPASTLAVGKGGFHTRLHNTRLCVTNTLEASGVQFPPLQKMCRTALPLALQGSSPGETPEHSSSCYTSSKAEEWPV